jgi:ribosomal protein S18 acetylase RimI-like enzyme
VNAKVYFSPRMTKSRVKAVADGVTKQLTEEMGRPASEVKNTDSAFWLAGDFGSVSSFLVWRAWDDDALWIVLAWTHPCCRCLGNYRRLLEHLKAHAKKAGYSRILCGIAPENVLSREVHMGMGMKPVMFEGLV